jgi:hypothetical protein
MRYFFDKHMVRIKHHDACYWLLDTGLTRYTTNIIKKTEQRDSPYQYQAAGIQHHQCPTFMQPSAI